MEFETSAEVRIPGTASDLLESVGLQRIDGAEADEPAGVLRDLTAGPVVFGFDSLVLVFELFLVWIREGVRDRKDHRATNTALVKKCNEVLCSYPLGVEGSVSRGSGAEEVLVMVNEFGTARQRTGEKCCTC